MLRVESQTVSKEPSGHRVATEQQGKAGALKGWEHTNCEGQKAEAHDGAEVPDER